MIELKAADLQAPPSIAALQNKALGIGLVGIAASIAGYLADPRAATESYLLAFIYWIAFPLGSLGLMMVHHLSGGGWGMPVRRIFEASARTLPFMALLGIPILLGMHHIYEWTDAAHVAADPILLQKQPYLNIPFFVARYVLYFVIWTGLAYTLSGWSRSQDTNYEPGSERKFRLLSGPGILLYAVASTFAVVDWLMSLDPHWFSTIFGLLFLIQQALAAIGFVLLLMASMSKTLPMSRIVRARRHPRLRQVPAHLRHGLGLLLVLAVPDHLVGEPARGDSLVSRAHEPRLGVVQHPADRRPVLPAVLPAAVARPQAHRRPRRHRRRAGPGDALRRLLLERDAGAEPRDADAALDQPGDAGRRSAASGSRSSPRSTSPRRCCRSAIRIFRRRSASHGAH